MTTGSVNFFTNTSKRSSKSKRQEERPGRGQRCETEKKIDAIHYSAHQEEETVEANTARKTTRGQV